MIPPSSSLADHAVALLLVLFAWLCIVSAFLFIVGRRVVKSQNRWKELLDGTRGDSLERLLYDHLKGRMELQERVDRLQGQVTILEQKMLTSKRHVGLVRYDAFGDVGGSQSFALAIYDDDGDGAIVTSLIGRSDCRVYCKQLTGGRSERTLSQEEQRAVMEATIVGPRAILTP